MHAKVIGPDRSCDGWRVVLAEEVDPVYVVAGNGATREQAIRAAIRETFVLLGTLARLLDDAIPDPRRLALEELHRCVMLHLAGRMPLEGLAEASEAVDQSK